MSDLSYYWSVNVRPLCYTSIYRKLKFNLKKGQLMTNILTHNLGYIQQYNRHLMLNNRNGLTNCQCKLYCASDAMYSEKIKKVGTK
jgi:hypothetical protein